MKKAFNKLQDILEDVSFNRWITEKSEQDRMIWEEWLEQHPEKQALVKEATSILTGVQFNPSYPSEEKVAKQLQLLQETIKAKEVAFKPSAKPVLRSVSRNSIAAIAAAITILLAVTFAIPLFTKASITEHTTAFGELKEVQLPDGSTVALNANSSLKYEAKHPRKIWLDGEAYFEVLKKPASGENFQVITDDLTVKVLGTTFNVNSRYDQTKVYLEEGKVILEVKEMDKDRIEMIPGEVVSYSKNAKKIIEKRTAKKQESTSWRNGVIRFEEATLSTVLQEITAIYGVEFNTQHFKPTGSLYSGGIPNSNLEIALEHIKEVYGIESVQEGNVYRIR